MQRSTPRIVAVLALILALTGLTTTTATARDEYARLACEATGGWFHYHPVGNGLTTGTCLYTTDPYRDGWQVGEGGDLESLD